MKVIRYAKLDLPVDLPQLSEEAAALPDLWSPHFQKAHYEGGWTALPLRAIGGDMAEPLPFALGTNPAEYAATPMLERCPAFGDFLASLLCPVMSARLLNLRPGGVIKPHRDPDLAFENGEARIHVPIFTNAAVDFAIEDQRVVMEPGTSWYINANLSHRAANHGDTDRIHLVVDCGVNDWLRDRFAVAKVSYSVIRRDPREVRQMIELLREMNTPASLALIAQLEEEISAKE
jgi:Aspartyl/Asparaginyl beta-hydroxylase